MILAPASNLVRVRTKNKKPPWKARPMALRTLHGGFFDERTVDSLGETHLEFTRVIFNRFPKVRINLFAGSNS